MALDPIETISDAEANNLLANPPQHEISDSEANRLLAGDFPIDVAGPAPTTRAGIAKQQNQLQFESQYQPATPLTPEGTNPRINYGPGEVTRDQPLTDTAAQLGLGLLQGGANIGHKIQGIRAMMGEPGAQESAETYSAVDRGLESVGKEIGGLPLLRHVTSGVVGSAPELLAGAAGGLPAIALSFGLSGAGDAFATAQEQGYEHPGMYALVSGIISAGTALIPGYKGPNMVAAGAKMLESGALNQTVGQLAKEFGGHAGATALMMGVQGLLQSALNKETIDPNLTWGDVVLSAAEGAGMGAILGVGFGGLGKASEWSIKRANQKALNPIFQQLLSNINSAQLQTHGLQPHEQRIDQPWYVDTRASRVPEDLDQAGPVPASMYPQPEATGSSLRQPTRGPAPVQPVPNTRVFDKPLSAEEVAAAQADLTRTEPVAPASQVVGSAAGKNLPDWAREAMVRQGLNPGRTFNDIDLQNPTVRDAIQSDPTLTPEQKASLLSTGAMPPKPQPQALTPEEQAALTADTSVIGDTESTRTSTRGPAPVTSAGERPPTLNRPGNPAWQVTVQAPTVHGSRRIPGYVQINDVGNGHNAWSAGPEKLRAQGYSVPDFSKLPQGKYSYADAVKKLNEPAPVPVAAPKPQVGSLRAPTPAPTQITSGLPAKGQELRVGDFIVTRNRLGSVVLTTPDERTRALAILTKEDAAALTPKAILDDLIATQKGLTPKYWDVKEVRSDLASALQEIGHEQVFGNPEQTTSDVVASLGKTPESLAWKQALSSKAIPYEVLVRLVGQDVAAKGGKATAEALTRGELHVGQNKTATLAQLIEQYKSGKLLERHAEDVAGTIPPELYKTESVKQDDGSMKVERTNQLLDKFTIDKTFKRRDIADRVISIVAGNRQVDLNVENKEAVKASGAEPIERQAGGGGIGGTKDLGELNPVVDKSGAYHGEQVTQFDDNDLDSPDKVKAAQQANDIKEAVLAGDTSQYDKAVEILTKVFGFSEGKAKDWMDSESLFMAPRHPKYGPGQKVIITRGEHAGTVVAMGPHKGVVSNSAGSQYLSWPVNKNTGELVSIHTRHVMPYVSGVEKVIAEFTDKYSKQALHTSLKEDSATIFDHDPVVAKLTQEEATDRYGVGWTASPNDLHDQSHDIIAHDRGSTGVRWSPQLKRLGEYLRNNHPEFLATARDSVDANSTPHNRVALYQRFALSKLIDLGIDAREAHAAVGSNGELGDWSLVSEDVRHKDPALAAWIEHEIFPGAEFGSHGSPEKLPGGRLDAGGKLRSATEADIKSPELYNLYKSQGVLEPTALTALDTFLENNPASPMRQLAQLLRDEYGNELKDVSVGNIGGWKNNTGGSYRPDLHKIKIVVEEVPSDQTEFSAKANIANTLLHETIHALSARKIALLPDYDTRAKELARLRLEVFNSLPEDLVRWLDKNFIESDKQWKDAGEVTDAAIHDLPQYEHLSEVIYGAVDDHEFVTQGLSSAAFIDYMRNLHATGDVKLSLWQRFKEFIRKLLFSTGKSSSLTEWTNSDEFLDSSILPEVTKALFDILDLPPVSKEKWLAAHSDVGEMTHNYPDIRNLKAYNEATDYQGDRLPADEKEVLTRKALANNNWLLASDVQRIIASVPKESKNLLNGIIQGRLDVVEQAAKEPGASKPSRLQDILKDPSLSDDRKLEIVHSVLENTMWFKNHANRLVNTAKRKADELVTRAPKLDKGIDEQTAKILGMSAVMDNLVTEFKESILKDKSKAVNVEQIEALNRMLALADEFRGNRKSAMSKLLSGLSEKVDFETLLTLTDPKQFLALIQKEYPIGAETTEKLGVNEDTQRAAAMLMARSNDLREQLLTLRLLTDEDFRHGLMNLNSEIDQKIREKNIGQVAEEFANAHKRIVTRREREYQVYNTLFKEKAAQLRAVKKYADAAGAMTSILNSKTFKDLDNLVTDKTGLMMPRRRLLPSGQLEYDHPLTRKPVVIASEFDRTSQAENYRKLEDLANSARLYLANKRGEHYSPAEAAFWRDFLNKSQVLLDPYINYDARKLVAAPWDPYKVIRVTGSMVMIPEHVLRRVGGSAANDTIAGLQSLATVDSQLGNLKKRYDASLNRTADTAAKAHELPVEQWHNEVLNPLIASRQTTGYEPLKVGSLTIYGHEILPADEKAFQAQREFDRELVKIATTGLGSTAVAFDPSKVTFKGPGGKQDFTRRILPTGPDTMSRRLDPDVQGLSTQWTNHEDPQARKQFMDSNFERVVLGHAATIGAPDYAIKSSMEPLYKAAMKAHRESPFTTTDELVDKMFDSQTNTAPEYQLSKEQILTNMMTELSTVFKRVSGFGNAKPSTDVGALLRVVDTDNSFTAARGKLIAPTTFYNYGLTFDGQRIGRMHSAKAYYTLQLAGKDGLFDRLIASVEAQKLKFEKQIEDSVKSGLERGKSIDATRSVSDKAQLTGEQLLTYDQTLGALRQLNQLKGQFQRILSRTDAATDPDARQLAQVGQSFIVANLLAGTAQVTNAFGGLFNIVMLEKLLLGKSVTASIVQQMVRTFVTKGPVELATLVTKLADPKDAWLLATLRNPVTRSVTSILADAIESRMQLHQQMEAYGLAPTSNIWQDMASILQMPRSGGRPQPANPTALQKTARALETGLGLVAVPLTTVAPRLVDRFVNELTVWKAGDIESYLRQQAVRYGEIEENTHTQVNPLTGLNTKQQTMMRDLFSRERINLDSVMRDYYQRQKADKTAPLFTPEQRAAFQYSLAQDINLPTWANRPPAYKGSPGRSMLSTFFGFPSWQASRLSDVLAKVSTDKGAYKYIPQAVAIAFSMAVLGAASVKVTKELKDLFFGEKSAMPDIFEAKDFGDAVQALTVGMASFLPFAGNIINNIILNVPGRNAFDVNSQFVMLNFANDIYGTIKKIYQTHDFARPLEDFMRRWSPLARIVINRLPNESGLTEYYNLSREIKSIAPASMETHKKGGGAMDATPATPMLQDMVNAAYKGDTAGFQDAANRYIQYKVGEGVSPAQAATALKESWKARHPFMREFGRMPTSAEEALIYSNASPEQRQAIDRANNIWSMFSGMLGTTFSIAKADSTGQASSLPPSGRVAGEAGAAVAGAPNTAAFSSVGSLRVGGTSNGGSGGSEGNATFGPNAFGPRSSIFGSSGGGSGGSVRRSSSPFRGPRRGHGGSGGSLRTRISAGRTSGGKKIEAGPKISLTSSRPASGGGKPKQVGSLRRRQKKMRLA